MERGICDLKTFADLRRTSGDPLDIAEIFMIMNYAATAMEKLAEIGLSLCDLKEENLLIKFSKEVIGYVPMLTDLGAAHCVEVNPESTYPMGRTCNYFDE